MCGIYGMVSDRGTALRYPEVLDFMGRPTVSIEVGIIVVTILGIMGLVLGFFPALKAASVNPVCSRASSTRRLYGSRSEKTSGSTETR